MNKWLRTILIGLAVLAVVLFAGFQLMMQQTKKSSPEDIVTLTDGDKKIEVFYCQPSKRDRVIFGELVPYGEVWRTGANEASTFENSHPLIIGDQTLPSGKYTLWTIPKQNSWDIIFNSKMYGWGVGWDAKALHEAEHDALTVTVPVQVTSDTKEMFTISLDNNPLQLVLHWDQTKVGVPLAWK